MKACTVPLTVFLHIGQSTIAGAHDTQHTRWPQGKKIIPTAAEKQILHVNWVIMSLTLTLTGGAGSATGSGVVGGWWSMLSTWVEFWEESCVALPPVWNSSSELSEQSSSSDSELYVSWITSGSSSSQSTMLRITEEGTCKWLTACIISARYMKSPFPA